MSFEFVDAIKSLFWSELSGKVHTALPGRVESYDKVNVRVEVTPLISKRFADDGVLDYGRIVDVPVMFPRTKNFHLSYPLESGDGVLLIFSERSLETFLKGVGKPLAPNDTRKFSVTDAIAYPGLFPFSEGAKISSGSEMELVFKGTKITSDGTDLSLEAKNLKIKGDVDITGDLKADELTIKGPLVDLDLSDHVHVAQGPTSPTTGPQAPPVPIP